MSKKNAKKIETRKNPGPQAQSPRASAPAHEPKKSLQPTAPVSRATKRSATKGRPDSAKVPEATLPAPSAGSAPIAPIALTPSREAKQPEDITRDPRLPAVGTTLVKRDRLGRARCECSVEAEGFRYRDTLHRSLSAAASAAAVDLGIKGRVNGFVFWGLAKPPGVAKASAEQLRKIAARYEEQAAMLLQQDGSPETRDELHRELKAHAAHVSELLARSAA